MKKYILTLTMSLGLLATIAQVPEDVLRYSYFPVNGSARNMAIGGAMGSLGGDINAIFVNPAGIGLYKTQELVLSPGLNFNNNKMMYRGTETASKKAAFNLGTSGFVFGFGNPGSKWTSQAIGLAVNTIANFNNTVRYTGLNNYSSYSEVFAEEFSKSRLTPDQALNDPRLAFGTAPAIYTYLIDTFRNGNRLDVKGLPEFLLSQGIALQQEKVTKTTGGITEVALAFASNMEDRLYIGGTVGLPIVKYDRHTQYTESDPSGNKNNNFDNFVLNDYITTTGVGLNAKLGMIYKPKEFIRLGVAVHTPTIYGFIDRQSSDLTANTEGYNGTATVSSTRFTGNNNSGLTQYTATTPWKAIMSGSYVFREIKDTRRQKAFITADIEYVGYPGTNFKADSKTATNADESYYQELKSVIKDYYKSAVNFRLGGELKFNTVMFRAGGAYYSNPYKDDNFKSNIIQATGGLGYRDQGVFIDLTYVHNLTKDVNFPYRLTDKQNTFAEQSGSRGNVMLTLGFKL